MTPHMIFDGYNLIYSATFGKFCRQKNASIQDKRECLVGLIAKHINGKNINATIVFDSPNHYVGSPLSKKSKKLTVVFAGVNENADERIVKLAINARSRAILTVVSSDEAHIGGFLRGCGIEVIKAEEFWQRLCKSSDREQASSDKPQNQTSEDISYWEKMFTEKK